MTTKTLKQIFDRTQGHCHFCGDPVVFTKYGLKNLDDINGVWEVDHIIQRGKGGSKNAENCLPACYRCNRLRWHRTGDAIRELLFLGLIAKDQILKNNKLGKEFLALKTRRELQNASRRRKLE